MPKNRLLGLLGLLGAGLVGGAILPSLIRWGTDYMHPFLVNWCRMTLGLPFLFLLLPRQECFSFLRQPQHLRTALLLGLGIGLNMTMFAFGVTRTTLIASQLIYVFTPAAAAIMAYLLLREKINTRKAGGMLLAFLGVLILLVFSNRAEERLALGTFAGNFLIFIGMFGYAAYVVFSKKISAFYSVLQMIFITNLTVSVLTLPLAAYGLYLGGLAQINLPALGVMLLLALSALLFMASSQLSIKHLSAHTASLSSLLSPEFAALAGIIVYGEQLSITLIVSLTLALLGTYISVSAEKSNFFARIKTFFNL